MSQNPFASPQAIDEPATLTEFKDRTTGLVLFGVLGVLIGLLFAMMFVFFVATHALHSPMPAWTMIPILSVYGLLAVGGVSLGIGSIRARRWARSLVLAVVWPWLIMGATGVGFFVIAVLPTMYAQFAQDGKIPPAAIVSILAFSTGFTVLFYVLLPLAIIAFYQSKHVQATCERRDPQPRWTDRCPQSVLTLSVMLAFGAYSLFWSALAGGMVFVFGAFLHGLSGAAVSLGIALLCGCLAWGVYRLRMAAWWSTVLLSVLVCASAVISSFGARWAEMYRTMGMNEAQIQATQRLAVNMQSLTGWGGIAVGLLLLGYLLSIRKHFVAAALARKPVESSVS